MVKISTQSITPHEALDLREILSFKTACLIKAQAFKTLATDQNLKSLLNQDAQFAEEAIQNIQELLQNAPQFQ